MNKNKDVLLRLYIQMSLNEGLYFVQKKDKKKTTDNKRGFFKKIWSLITGSENLDKTIDDWIGEVELLNDVSLPEELKKKIEIISKKKWQSIVEKSKGDEDRAERMLKRSLDHIFKPQISQLRRNEND